MGAQIDLNDVPSTVGPNLSGDLSLQLSTPTVGTNPSGDLSLHLSASTVGANPSGDLSLHRTPTVGANPSGDLTLHLTTPTGSGGEASPRLPAEQATQVLFSLPPTPERTSQVSTPPRNLEYVYGLVAGSNTLQIYLNPLYKEVMKEATTDEATLTAFSNLVPTRRGNLFFLLKKPYMPPRLTQPNPSGGRDFVEIDHNAIPEADPSKIVTTRKLWNHVEKTALALGYCYFRDS